MRAPASKPAAHHASPWSPGTAAGPLAYHHLTPNRPRPHWRTHPPSAALPDQENARTLSIALTLPRWRLCTWSMSTERSRGRVQLASAMRSRCTHIKSCGAGVQVAASGRLAPVNAPLSLTKSARASR